MAEAVVTAGYSSKSFESARYGSCPSGDSSRGASRRPADSSRVKRWHFSTAPAGGWETELGISAIAMLNMENANVCSQRNGVSQSVFRLPIRNIERGSDFANIDARWRQRDGREFRRLSLGLSRRLARAGTRTEPHWQAQASIQSLGVKVGCTARASEDTTRSGLKTISRARAQLERGL